MLGASPSIRIELFGMARRRAGRADFMSHAATIREALDQLAESCPNLVGMIQADGQLSPRYLISVNAGPFVTELHQLLKTGDRLLLLSADAGG
jgi:molybdopterin converting factor small subunit